MGARIFALAETVPRACLRSTALCCGP